MSDDYGEARKLGLTAVDRWAEGREHHPKTKRLFAFIARHDAHDFGDYFFWKMGGDGDNGETLMFEMDTYFEFLDTLK